MKTCETLLLGLAGLGFVLAMPTHAASPTLIESPTSIVQGFAIAARANAEARQEQRRDSRDEERRGQQNQQMRDAEQSFVPQEYGYGYERRQQPLQPREESRRRH